MHGAAVQLEVLQSLVADYRQDYAREEGKERRHHSEGADYEGRELLHKSSIQVVNEDRNKEADSD